MPKYSQFVVLNYCDIMFVLEVLASLAFFIFALSSFFGVPFLPTHKAQVVTMMDLAEIGPDKILVDLGSGAGRLLFGAASKGATAIGYEINPFLVLWTKFQIWKKGLSGKVQVRWCSLYNADIKNADVVVIFLFEKFMAQLEKKIFDEMKPGSKVVAYVFPFKNRKEIIKKEGLFLYKI